METKAYELAGGYTFTGTCTCGSCRKALRDQHGNIDYGYRWSEKLGEYLPRSCEIAAQRRGERS